MKNSIKIFCLTLLATCLFAGSVQAEKVKGVVRKSSPKAESATCLPAASSNELTVNNVRAYIETGGTMWFKEIAEYEVPKGSNKTSMFSAGLWIGGLDVNGQLKLAAVRFRQVGDDYWTGPLKTTGASTTQSMCIKFDKLFKITRSEVDRHISGYNTSGYVMPSSIANWPAHGDEGYSYFLAPFKDVNGNSVYDPENGDYPYYDINNDLCPWTEDNIALAAAHALPRTPEDLMYYGTDWHNSNGMIYADHVLKGDETLFWIFNDNAGPHTESSGSPIGLEIRGQAFGFATNDELNNMTFYSYEIINRSTYRLTNTYFSQWVDPDLGYAKDDYVGCDVSRGLGYCYNGSNVDGTGQIEAYGDQPPAVGVDFFQGPYMDADGRDNPKFYPDSASVPGYCDRFLKGSYPADQMAINGVNFGDQIVDNERFGMRRFVYHNNDNSVTGDPRDAYEYYNMLQGIWKDNTKMKYGGNAHTSNGGNGPDCDFMFPALSDVCNWGTKGVDPNLSQYGADGWTEANVGNAPYDRRFMQSAGPFTLQPGSVNYITVGIPWARASQGGAQASVELLKLADDKCQSLFENCFKTLDGPDAPDITIRELENELILYISNEDKNSNNYHETYEELDPQITRTLSQTSLVSTHDTVYTYHADGTPDTIVTETIVPVTTHDTLSTEQRKYHFEGYQIYQLANASVSVTDLNDASKAVLIGQCDVENEAGQLINWVYNEALASSVATEMVNGSNNGIFHSFSVKEDKFATGTNKRLVNHKQYYFLVLAYGYNCYKEFKLEDGYLDGQISPYLAGRRNIKVYTGTPHKSVENLQQAVYGDQPMITRIEGQGNGGFFLDMTDESRDMILANNVYNNIQYKNNYGPLNIMVVDPLQVKPFDYYIKFLPNDVDNDVNDSTEWQLIISDEVTDEELAELGIPRVDTAGMPISKTNEQLFLDLGISVSLKNAQFKIHQKDLDEYVASTERGYSYSNLHMYGQVDFVGSSIDFGGGSAWLSGVSDIEGDFPANWIHSGQYSTGKWYDWAYHGHPDGQDGAEDEYGKWRTEDMCMIVGEGVLNKDETSRAFKDPNQQFEKVINGTWSPYVLSSPYDGGPQAKYLVPDDKLFLEPNGSPTPGAQPSPAYFSFSDFGSVPRRAGYNQTMTNLYSIDVVLTSDKSKWTRALVLEAGGATQEENYMVTQEFHGAIYHNVRHEPKKCPSVDKDGNPETNPFAGQETGFGWFPGYAINVETGERLNIMFAENSLDTFNHGNDMIFNPTDVYAFYRNLETGEYIYDEETGEPFAMSQTVFNNYREAYGVLFGEPLNGGRHYIYVCGSSGNTCSMPYHSASRHRNYNDGGTVWQNNGGTIEGTSLPFYECGPYDECAWLNAKFKSFTGITTMGENNRMRQKMQLFNNVMWTSIPMPAVNREKDWLSTDATIKIRVSRPYLRYSSRWYDDPSTAPNTSLNDGYPMYEFTTKNLAPKRASSEEEIQTLLDEINIVPNPYYGFSQYENTALENYVRIVNLPTKCTISIFTVNGTLIRTITKGDAATSYVQWDLKNHANIPISGGVYIIHVKADGIGERTLKFFCAMRPTDLNGF
ncbi:MAG: T9SS type A sorting domain-containing protein [Bacteroidales bacterium]|nr:T9SS type A sorting domain-containing protein [Bacteroidales bacterium]